MCKDNDENQIHVHLDLSGEARNSIGSIFSKKKYVAVGFGTAVIQKDGIEIFDGEQQEELTSLEDAEKEIIFENESEYILILDAPLWDARWRRNQKGEWICIEAGMGFA